MSCILNQMEVKGTNLSPTPTIAKCSSRHRSFDQDTRHAIKSLSCIITVCNTLFTDLVFGSNK